MTSSQSQVGLRPGGPSRLTRAFSNYSSRQMIIQGVTCLAAVALWEILGETGLIWRGLVPPASSILRSSWEMIASGLFFVHLKVTLYEVGVGFLVASLVGIVLGVALGSRQMLGQVFEPLIYYFAAVPKIILFPILLILFGVGPDSKVAMGALSGIFPIVVNAYLGSRQVSPRFVQVGRSVCASRWQIYRKIYLPSMVYPIALGLRLGIGVTLVGALLGELKISNAGLGFLTIEFYDHFNIKAMYGVLLLIFLLAGLLNLLMTLLLHRLRRYRI